MAIQRYILRGGQKNRHEARSECVEQPFAHPYTICARMPRRNGKNSAKKMRKIADEGLLGLGQNSRA